ncbi:GTPase-activating protein [Coemansia sp. RSA 2131]|nr:GTPase-activating protein [Coemansia sp. RSA 2131]
MSTVDGPVKKSLRSKRLMRPAKSKARKPSDATDEPKLEAHNEVTDGDSAASKPEAWELGSVDADKHLEPAVVDRNSGTTDVDTDGHSGTTDVDTVGNRGSTYSEDNSMRELPVVSVSASSNTTYTESSADVFVEASEPTQDIDLSLPLPLPTDESKQEGQDFMQMLGDLPDTEEPQNFLDGVGVDANTSGGGERRGSDTGLMDAGFMESLSAGPDLPDLADQGLSESHATSVRRESSGRSAGNEDVAAVKDSELEAEHSRLGNHGSDRSGDHNSSRNGDHSSSRNGDVDGGRNYGLGRSASVRIGSRGGSGERRRPSEAVISPSSAGSSKQGNRRSIMLTSFVPPVGMSGGGSSTGSRSSTESPGGSINEALVDHAALNGVVEISAGRTFKRSSILDSQLGSSTSRSSMSRSSHRGSQDMASIRLRPSEAVSASASLPSDVKSVAKTALKSISERIGGAGSANSAPADSGEDDEDDGMPEWMKEVQRRKREARKQEEDARAARAAAEAEEAEEAARAEAAKHEAVKLEAVKHEAAKQEAARTEAAKLEAAKYEAAKHAEQAMPTPVSIQSYDVRESLQTIEPIPEPSTSSIGNAIAITSSAIGRSDDDDDMPLTNIDLSDRNQDFVPNVNKPLPADALAPKPVSTQQQPPVTTRSIYRSLSASLGISQSAQEAESPARQSGPPLPTLSERQRSTSQTASSPTQSQNGIFAAVTSFFGRASTQLSAPPSASASITPAVHSGASSSSNISRGTIEFPGMRPSGTEARPGDTGDSADPAMDVLLHQLEAQNQQIMKDNKARVFAPAEAVERADDDSVDWDFWGNLINNYEGATRSEPRKLARSVYRGIPKAVRGTVWQLMAKSRDDPELGARFRRLVAQRSEPGSEGASHEKQIRHDLARTFPKLDYFRDVDGAGQEGLFNVLRAYALFDPEVGYCQGLSFVVGPLLLNMPDEEAFCVLVKLMYTYGLRGHFLPSMDDLQLRLYQFEHVLADALPWLSRHFQEQGVLPTMYVSQWLMTMFAYRLPIELTFRLFDVVFAEGLDCLLRVAIAVLKRSQTRLLTLEFEGILQYLNDGPLFAFYSHAAPDMLVRDSNQVSINARALQKLRRQYIDDAQRKLEEEDEVSMMRAENEQLKAECTQLRSALQSGEMQGEKQGVDREERARLARQIEELETQLQNERREAEVRLQDERREAETRIKADMDQLAQKNVQLTIKNQQLEDGLQDMEEALVQIKMLYAESEDQREVMTKRFEDLRKALK